MAEYIDILLSEGGQSLQNDGNGDFKVGDASNQLMYYIIVSGTGTWKEFPLVGVGIEQYLNADVSPFVLGGEIAAQLAVDVFQRVNVDASEFPSTLYVNKTEFNFG